MRHRVRPALAAASLAAAWVPFAGMAFHSGGVAECGGCHSMHAPEVNASGAAPYLLVAATASDTCLACHAAPDTAPTRYHVMTWPAGGLAPDTVPAERTPGGDFAWVGIDTVTPVGRAGVPQGTFGRMRGHNVVAPAFGLAEDADHATAPGSGDAFASANLGCNSCHDPHGRLRRIATGADGDVAYAWARAGAPVAASGSYSTSPAPTAALAVGAYRILRGRGDGDAGAVAAVPAGGFAGNLLAIAPNSPAYAWNASEATTPIRVAYGAAGDAPGADTVGRWCASCHPDMHSSGTTQPMVHPVDRALGGHAAIYGAYVRSGVVSGSAAASYLSLVPFATATGDFATLKAQAVGTNLAGPAESDQVTCLSCHRAHASGFKHALRWDYDGGEFVTATGPDGVVQWMSGTSAGGLSQAQVDAAYQDIPASRFGPDQRQLCNKCHAKD